jgi:hypothetical protein
MSDSVVAIIILAILIFVIVLVKILNRPLPWWNGLTGNEYKEHIKKHGKNEPRRY